MPYDTSEYYEKTTATAFLSIKPIMLEIENAIHEWIKKISEAKEDLGGFSICPFADKGTYKIIKCNANDISVIDGYDAIIFVVESNLTLDMVSRWVEIYNKKYLEWAFFEDCATYDTYIQKNRTNNGKYNLIIAQPKQKLAKYRQILSKTDYYSYWDKEYLKEILKEDIKILNQGIGTP